MDAQSLIIMLAIGAVAGWLAGQIMRGGGFGLLWNIVIGIVGSIIGGWLFGELGISSGGGLLGSLLVSVVGAVVLLLIAGLIKR